MQKLKRATEEEEIRKKETENASKEKEVFLPKENANLPKDNATTEIIESPVEKDVLDKEPSFERLISLFYPVLPQPKPRSKEAVSGHEL